MNTVSNTMNVWIFQCLVWVSLMLNPSFGYRDYDQDYSFQRRDTTHRKTDLSTQDRPGYDRQNRQIENDDRQSGSERSILFDFNIQRVQGTSRIPIEDSRRNGESTLKIINNFAKPVQILTRRGIGHHDPTKSTGEVVFPGPTSRTSSFEPQVTDQECLQTGICEHVDNYPQEKVDEVVTKLESSKYNFNVDRLVTPEIAQRIGPHDEMMELCKSKETVVAPRAVRDDNSKWYVVVNQKNQVLQGFRVEICEPASAPCSDLIYVMSSSYNKTCVQKYQYRKMVVLNDDGNHTEKEFKIPSCCSCAVFPVTQ